MYIFNGILDNINLPTTAGNHVIQSRKLITITVPVKRPNDLMGNRALTILVKKATAVVREVTRIRIFC